MELLLLRIPFLIVDSALGSMSIVTLLFACLGGCLWHRRGHASLRMLVASEWLKECQPMSLPNARSLSKPAEWFS